MRKRKIGTTPVLDVAGRTARKFGIKGAINPAELSQAIGVQPTIGSGYATKAVVMKMRCPKGHTVNTGEQAFSDGVGLYCPTCGGKLQHATL